MQVRNTNAKSHIVLLLTEASGAMSPLEIQQLSEGICDRVTIYRVLDRLISEGVIHKTVGLDGIARFAMCKHCGEDHKHSHNHNHVHFSCEACLKVICLEDIIPDFKLPRKFKVKDVNFNVSGICPDCV